MITHLSAFWGDLLWKQGSNLQLSHLDVTDLQTRTENVCLCACVGVGERERDRCPFSRFVFLGQMFMSIILFSSLK